MTETRSPYHHGQLRAALLTAGDEVLKEVGFKGFTLRACARRAGVSHAAPKHHFGDVAGFLTEIAALGFGRLTARLQEEIRRAPTLADEFVATTHAYMAFADEYPEHFRIMFRCDLVNPESPVLRRAATETFTELTNVIIRQRGEEEITVDMLDERMSTEDLLQDIIIGWCHIHGFAHLTLERQMGLFENEAIKGRLVETSGRRLSELLQRK